MTTKAAIVSAVCAVAALAALPALAGTGSTSALPTGNLVQNPGAEAGPGGKNYEIVAVPGWQVSPGFTVYQYLPKALDLPSAEDSGRIGGGGNFFLGGGGKDAVATATQVIDVSGSAGLIDAGAVSARLTALIGGSRAQEDNGSAEAAFLDQAGTALGAVRVGPVTAAQRKLVSKLLPQDRTGAVPVGTRSIRVTLTATRVHGSYNEAIFDNIAVALNEPKQLATVAATCKKGTVTITASPVKGLRVTSVALGAGTAAKTLAAAPYRVAVAAAKGVKKVTAVAVVTDSSGRATTVKKTVKAC